MICEKLRPVSRKMWQFHLNSNIEGTFWHHAVTSSTSKVLLGANFERFFHIECQNEPIRNISKSSYWPPLWGQGELLNRKLSRKLSPTARFVSTFKFSLKYRFKRTWKWNRQVSIDTGFDFSAVSNYFDTLNSFQNALGSRGWRESRLIHMLSHYYCLFILMHFCTSFWDVCIVTPEYSCSSLVSGSCRVAQAWISWPYNQ